MPIATTKSRKKLPEPDKGSAYYPNGPGAAPSTPPTSYADGSTTATAPVTQTTTISDFINRSGGAYAKTGTTAITESKGHQGIMGQGTQTTGGGPAWKTDFVITGGTTTPIAITVTMMPPPQTTTDPAGRIIVVSPPPVQTVQTVKGVLGGHAVQIIDPDDSLTTETSTMTAVVGGLSVTLLAISTPGRPTTETLVSVVGGTAVTVTAPKPFVSDLGGGVLTAITRCSARFVTTTGSSVST